MSSRHLPHYIRSHRKQLGLSQRDIAFLAGLRSGGPLVSKYESFRAVPTLETALALVIIFRVPVNVLFHGLHQEIESRLEKQAKKFAKRVEQNESISATEREIKLRCLSRICGMRADKNDLL